MSANPFFFNHLSGMYVDVSNFPGTNISITKGNFKEYEIYDTPGVYGVSSFNDEEKIIQFGSKKVADIYD